MNYDKVIDLISKGMKVISVLWEAADDAGPAIKALKDFVSGVQTGNITDAQFEAVERVLDGLIEEFNIEVP